MDSYSEQLQDIKAGEMVKAVKAASLAGDTSDILVLDMLIAIRTGKDINEVDAIRPGERGRLYAILRAQTQYTPDLDEDGFMELSIGRRIKPRYASGPDIRRLWNAVVEGQNQEQVAVSIMLASMYGIPREEMDNLAWGEFEYLFYESETKDFLDSIQDQNP